MSRLLFKPTYYAHIIAGTNDLGICFACCYRENIFVYSYEIALQLTQPTDIIPFFFQCLFNLNNSLVLFKYTIVSLEDRITLKQWTCVFIVIFLFYFSSNFFAISFIPGQKKNNFYICLQVPTH